jgi:hypothetical protein
MQPAQYKLDDLLTLSERVGVFIQIVPCGVELIPPSENVETFGLHPGLQETKQYLSYLFHQHHHQQYDDFDLCREQEKETLMISTTMKAAVQKMVDPDRGYNDGYYEDVLGSWQ